MVDWKSFWFTLFRCCLEEIQSSICCQLYPEWIKPVTLTSTCIFIFLKLSIFLISFNYQLFFLAHHSFVIILTVITKCTTCNIQRCETWPRATISDTRWTCTRVRGVFTPNIRERGIPAINTIWLQNLKFLTIWSHIHVVWIAGILIFR